MDGDNFTLALKHFRPRVRMLMRRARDNPRLDSKVATEMLRKQVSDIMSVSYVAGMDQAKKDYERDRLENMQILKARKAMKGKAMKAMKGKKGKAMKAKK